MSAEVLVVAGEASGDRIAALTARALAEEGVRCAGVAGPVARAAGVRALADGAGLGAMGVGDVLRALPRIGERVLRLLAGARRDPPRAALLVNFTELNQRLGRLLCARGTRVLWCVAPQVWAWRPGRVHALRGAFDRLAVILPFEEALWRAAGHDAVHVGHPVTDGGTPAGTELRASLRIAARSRAIAVLAGSREGEVRRLSSPLCEAAARLLDAGDADDARVIAAPGLPPRAREQLERAARDADLAVIDADPEHGAAPLLAAFDASLCASGTASLESAFAGAAPVVCARLDPIAYAVARRLVRTPFVALPNVILGRAAFPELIQADAVAPRIAEAARALLRDRERAQRDTEELRAALRPPSPLPFGRRVADLLLPWVHERAR